MTTAAERAWMKIAEAEQGLPGVSGGTGFGRSAGLRIDGKVYAMLVDGELVVKLPKDRVDTLVAKGGARRFGHGARVMKEWATLPSGTSRRWKTLVAEAKAFVVASER
jgi:TfoX/Sxy family transcriptional regulator of competence genes